MLTVQITVNKDNVCFFLCDLGYEFDENDVHDVKLLCETFHIEVPNEYR